MSVYTQLSTDDFDYICQQYQLGQLIDFNGVADGIENTTYFFTTQDSKNAQSKWVFTLFEYTNEQALPYYLELYSHLYQKGVPVPEPQLNNQGKRLITLHDKPGAVFPRLPGRPPKEVTKDLCYQCGVELAKFHIAGESYPEQHECPKGLDFWQASVTNFSVLSEADKALIQQTISEYLEVIERLPKTSCHGDLFHDNVLVSEGTLTAIIDLFNASYDYAVLDLAITLNDWTIDIETLQASYELHQALIDGYQSERPLTDAEMNALPVMQRVAALRFWLSRIDTALAFEEHQHASDSDDHAISTKDPDQMKALLVSLQG